MKLIIGLGNPGTKYEHTRHNFGFQAVDFLRKEWGFPEFTANPDFFAELSEGPRENGKIILVRPQTFMNESGKAVAALARFYKVSQADITILHDDLDLPFGELRVTKSSRAAGHNGVQDIIDTLGTQDFRRIRLGIGRPENEAIDPADFVLQPFPESVDLAPVLERVVPLL
jgi:PTH1 family peptidyl-tRNA hydrolase